MLSEKQKDDLLQRVIDLYELEESFDVSDYGVSTSTLKYEDCCVFRYGYYAPNKAGHSCLSYYKYTDWDDEEFYKKLNYIHEAVKEIATRISQANNKAIKDLIELEENKELLKELLDSLNDDEILKVKIFNSEYYLKDNTLYRLEITKRNKAMLTQFMPLSLNDVPFILKNNEKININSFREELKQKHILRFFLGEEYNKPE